MKSLLTILIFGAVLANAQTGGGPGHGSPTDPNAPMRAAITSDFTPIIVAPNELTGYSGIPCLYDVYGTDVFSAIAGGVPYIMGQVYTGSNGIGCVCLGACANSPLTSSIEALFVQTWGCSYSVVEATGAAGETYFQDPNFNQGQPYPNGLIVRGSAEVVNYAYGFVTTFQGYDIATCLSNNLTKPYDYTC